MKILSIITAVTVSAALISCASDPYPGSTYAHYERYQPTIVELAKMRDKNSDGTYTVADIDVVNYADHVKTILRTKFTNARFARYTSTTGQVLFAAASGVAAAFSAGATLITTLALSSAAIPQLGDIFNAKARAGIYQDAVSKIEDAESAYYVLHHTPSTTDYTPEADILYKNVTGNVHTVEKAVLGELPDIKASEDANKKSGPSGGTTTVSTR